LRNDRTDEALSYQEDTMEDRVRREHLATDEPVSEWAKSEMRDLADTARQRVHGAKGEAKEYVAEAKEYVQGAVQQTKEYVEEAREYIGDAVQQARDKVSEYRDGGVERMRHDVVGYTREQPMTALLIAAGAGLVVGWLSALGRR
jgi:ElaB/YqjD/DUF883 family membrane-anchored ribosome-binding protein